MKENAQQLLEQWRIATIGRLVAGYGLLLENVGDVLIDFASESESLSVQTDFYDAQREFYIKGRATTLPFQQKLNENRLFFNKNNNPHPLGEATLSLLEHENYELSIALETISTNCVARNQQNYHALHQRLSALSGGQKIKLKNIPLNPPSVTKAFEKSIQPLTLANPVLLVLFTLFDRYVVSELDSALSLINKQLADAGILPTIKYTINQRAENGHKQTEVSHTTSKLDNESMMLDGNEAESYFAPPTPSVPTSKESLQAIGQLLSKQRRINESSSKKVTTNLPRVNQAIEDSDQQLHAANPTIYALESQSNKLIVDKQLLLKVRSTLKQQRMMIQNMAGQKNIAEQEKNAIDIIGMLFEAILDDSSIPAPVKTLLSHLHTPLLKIAVNDPSLLQDTNHPARQILETMLRLGIRWVNPERLKSGIFPSLQYCVKKIADNPNQIDYEHLYNELEKREKQLKKNKVISEKRTLDTEKGQAKLAQAKTTAHSATQTLISEHNLPSSTRVFLQTIFTDYLSLILLRNEMKPEHPHCQTALHAAIKMIEDIDHGDLLKAQASGKELGQLILTLLPHYDSNISEFLKQLSQSPKYEQAMVSPPILQQEKTPPFNAKLKAQALNLVPGSWLYWRENSENEAKSIKLIWINPHTERLLFVDQNGNKIAHIHANRVAEGLNDGTFELALAQRKKGLFDNLLSNIKNKLEEDRTEPTGARHE